MYSSTGYVYYPGEFTENAVFENTLWQWNFRLKQH
jgi:hypothetical protein